MVSRSILHSFNHVVVVVYYLLMSLRGLSQITNTRKLKWICIYFIQIIIRFSFECNANWKYPFQFRYLFYIYSAFEHSSIRAFEHSTLGIQFKKLSFYFFLIFILIRRPYSKYDGSFVFFDNMENWMQIQKRKKKKNTTTSTMNK